MRGLIAVCLIAFAIGLGVLAGHKLAAESMAVVVGVVCGVTASVPMSILMLILVKRTTASQSTPSTSQQAQYPPVIVVSGGQPQLGPPNDNGAVEGQWREPGPRRREFRMIGEE